MLRRRGGGRRKCCSKCTLRVSTPCNVSGLWRRLGITYCLHMHGWRNCVQIDSVLIGVKVCVSYFGGLRGVGNAGKSTVSCPYWILKYHSLVVLPISYGYTDWAVDILPSQHGQKTSEACIRFFVVIYVVKVDICSMRCPDLTLAAFMFAFLYQHLHFGRLLY